MYKQGTGVSIISMGLGHSKEASVPEVAYVTAKLRADRPRQGGRKEGASTMCGRTVICPGFVRTPLVESRSRAGQGARDHRGQVIRT